MAYDKDGNYQFKTYEDLSFNPEEKMIKMKSSSPNYLEVKWRLVMLRELYPEAQVITNVMWHDEEKRNCYVAATISLPPAKVHPETGHVIIPGAIGTGHKMECYSDFRDYVEKAETGAIGRALGAVGVGLQYSEVEFDYESASPKEYTGVDSPVVEKAKTPRRTKPLTREEVVAKITAEVGRLGVSTIQSLSMSLFGVSESSKLTNDQLAKLIEEASKIESIG